MIKAAALIALALALAAAPAGANPPPRRPVVVELFTSQGCSSCPPANAALASVSAEPGVVALTFDVTYWDYLGWKDTFARPEYTQRQTDYEPPLHQASTYTPQVVVMGAADTVGQTRQKIDALIAKASPAPGAPEVSLTPHGARIGAGHAPRRPADVWLVRYDPRVVQVPIRRGENGGKTLPQKNVVRSLVRLGAWRGEAAHFTYPPEPVGLKTAVLVQGHAGGPILAAAVD